jgi:hypothetical protein
MAVENGQGEGTLATSMEGDGPPSRKGKSKLRMGAILATVATLIGIMTGILTIRDQLFSDNGGEQPPATSPPEKTRIARFEGVAGHLAESRAILDFLDQHDHETVYLDVGFPDHATGVAGGDNILVETVPYKGGTTVNVTSFTLVTECNSGVAPGETPTIDATCVGTSLDISGPETDDSGTFFQHGVPVIKGHFVVDVTGALQMGRTPIYLKPVTFEQATASG